MRVPGSGPWHWKQFSERMGRTSRWKSTPPGAPWIRVTRVARMAQSTQLRRDMVPNMIANSHCTGSTFTVVLHGEGAGAPRTTLEFFETGKVHLNLIVTGRQRFGRSD